MKLSITISTLSDVGRRRNRNEDAIASDEAEGILVVADGMGGHPAGDVASRLAVEEALDVLRSPATPVLTGTEDSPQDAGVRMALAVRSADERIRDEGRRNPSLEGMGTTLTVFRVDREGGRYQIGHVGDSRAYRFRAAVLRQLTRDDTWVQSQIDAGRIKPENARDHPWASLLSQAVGVEPPPEPSVFEGELKIGDVYLVCSDGLVTHLLDEQIHRILERHLSKDLGVAAQALVDAANAGGGIDNITVGLLRVGAPDPTPPPTF